MLMGGTTPGSCGRKDSVAGRGGQGHSPRLQPGLLANRPLDLNLGCLPGISNLERNSSEYVYKVTSIK